MADRLLVAACERRAAEYAVMHWHYSRTMPSGKLITFGVWEDGEFRGSVLYGRGATPRLLDRFDVDQTEGAELVRVALRDHASPVSQIVAQTVALLRTTNPGLRVLVSFADPGEGHHGGIYQAMNWTYLGTVEAGGWWRINGRLVHPRSVVGKYGTQATGWIREHVDPNAEKVDLPGKYRYALGLDRRMRRRLVPLALPYPSSAVEVSDGETPRFHRGGTGSIPVDRSK